jgi:hypothetical protein
MCSPPRIEDVGEQATAHRVADALAIGDGSRKRRQRFEFQREVGLQQFLRVLADAQLAQRLEVRQAFEEEDAIGQAIGMLHLVDRFLVLVLGEFLQAPVLQHLACRKYWLIAVSSLKSARLRCSMTLGSPFMCVLRASSRGC